MEPYKVKYNDETVFDAKIDELINFAKHTLNSSVHFNGTHVTFNLSYAVNVNDAMYKVFSMTLYNNIRNTIIMDRTRLEVKLQ